MEGFLGNHKAQNYKQFVENMLHNLKRLDAHMSIKVHYLFSHLDKFPKKNLGDFNEEQGERFHQDLNIMDERYQGGWVSHIMTDYCWNLMRE